MGAFIENSNPRYHQIMLVGDENNFTPYGLTLQELEKLTPLITYDGYPPANYQLIRGPTILAISALGHLGYHVISSIRKKGSNNIVWVLEKTLKHPFDTIEALFW